MPSSKRREIFMRRDLEVVAARHRQIDSDFAFEREYRLRRRRPQHRLQRVRVPRGRAEKLHQQLALRRGVTASLNFELDLRA